MHFSHNLKEAVPHVLIIILMATVLQLITGKKAEISIPSLPVDSNHHLRCCRDMSNKGDKLVVGNSKGMIQVKKVGFQQIKHNISAALVKMC